MRSILIKDRRCKNFTAEEHRRTLRILEAAATHVLNWYDQGNTGFVTKGDLVGVGWLRAASYCRNFQEVERYLYLHARREMARAYPRLLRDRFSAHHDREPLYDEHTVECYADLEDLTVEEAMRVAGYTLREMGNKLGITAEGARQRLLRQSKRRGAL